MIDQFVVDAFDKVAAYAQRRGILLTVIQLVNNALSLFFCIVLTFIAGDLTFTGAFFITFWVFVVRRSWRHHRRYHTYPENVRLTQSLNAQVMTMRAMSFSRTFLFVWYIAFLGSGVFYALLTMKWGLLALMLPSTITAGGFLWWDLCFYLGPGEFGKKKQERFSRDHAFGREP